MRRRARTICCINRSSGCNYQVLGACQCKFSVKIGAFVRPVRSFMFRHVTRNREHANKRFFPILRAGEVAPEKKDIWSTEARSRHSTRLTLARARGFDRVLSKSIAYHNSKSKCCYIFSRAAIFVYTLHYHMWTTSRQRLGPRPLSWDSDLPVFGSHEVQPVDGFRGQRDSRMPSTNCVRPVATQAHAYDTCQDMRTHAKIMFTKGGSQDETRPGFCPHPLACFVRPVECQAPRDVVGTAPSICHSRAQGGAFRRAPGRRQGRAL